MLYAGLPKQFNFLKYDSNINVSSTLKMKLALKLVNI